MNNNYLTEFNEGKSHNENPLGGIPIGQDDQGNPNLVEQGETKNGDFVYSNRVTLTPDVVHQMNLPKSFIGKTAADASKVINSKFKDRNDKISNSTKTNFLDKIAQAQESIKAQQQAQIQASMQMNSIQAPEDMMNGQIPQGMEEYSQNQMAWGGNTSMSGLFGSTQPKPEEQKFNTEKLAGYGQMAGQLGEIFGAQGSYGKQIQQNAGVGFHDSKLEKDKRDEEMLGKTKDTISSAFGPFGQLFRGIQKAGKGLGDSIGGESGAAISGAFSPEEATMANLKDDDLNVGQKLLGTVPGLGAVQAHRQAEKRKNKFMKEQQQADTFYKYNYTDNIDRTKVFVLGGELGSFNTDPTDRTKGRLPTKKDTMDLQKYSKAKIKQLRDQGYVERQSFLKPEGYSNVHSDNDAALEMLRSDYANKKRREVLTETGSRKQIPYDPSFYQRQHPTNPNQYYNQEGASGLGVVNPNANYLLFDRMVNPNKKSEWVNPLTGDGVEAYEYDFGSKYDPKPKPHQSSNKIVKPISSKGKPGYVAPKGLSPVSLGYSYANGGYVNNKSSLYANGGPLTQQELSQIDQRGFPYWDDNYNKAMNPLFNRTSIVPEVNSQLRNEQPVLTFGNQGLNVSNQSQLTGIDNLSSLQKSNYGTSNNKRKGTFGFTDSAMRFAPVLANYAQLRGLSGPEVEKLDRMNRSYQKQYLDEATYENQAREQASNTINALSRSGLSSGQLLNAQIASQLANTRSVADAYDKIKQFNISENKIEQDVLRQNDQANISQSNLEKDINARNRGNYETQRSKLQGQIGTDLGEIGKEQTYKKMVKEIYGYDWNGKYYVNDKGEQKTPEEIAKLTEEKKSEENTKKALGGYLRNAKKSFKY